MGIGRPSKLTPESQERFIKALKQGAHLEVAAQAAGIDYTTYLNWMKRGEVAKSGTYFDFYQAVTRAIADAEMVLLARVNVASQQDWRAASWILERRHPERWANTQRVKLEVEKELQQTLDRLESTLSPEVYQQVLTAIAGGEPDAE